MLSKKQKKLFKKLSRDMVRHGRKRELRSMFVAWHRVIYDDSWTEFTIVPFNHDRDNQFEYLCDYFDDEMQAYWDCSGKPFISGYRVTSMPCGFAIVVYYDIDC